MRPVLLLILVFFFSAGAGALAQWEPERKLSTTDSAAFPNENMGTSLAARGDTVHAVWYDAKNNGSAIYYKRSTDGGVTWDADRRLSAVPGAEDFPSLAVAEGVVHIVSRQNRGGRNVTLYRRSTDGGTTWNPPVLLDTMYWWPSVAASGLLVTVAENDTLGGGNSEVFFRRSTDAGLHWEALQRISNAPNRSEDPAIAVAGAFVHMVWNDKRSGIMQSYYRRSTDAGASWGAEAALTSSTVMAYSPMVALDGMHVDVVWEDRRSGQYEIWRRHSSDRGLSWEPEEQLTRNDRVSYLYPVVAREGVRVHIIWFGDGLRYIHSSDGGVSWIPAAVLVDSAFHPGRSYVALSGQALHLIWSDTRSGHAAIYYRRNPTGNGGPTTQIRETAVSSAIPAYSAAPNPFRSTSRIPGHEAEMFLLYDVMGRSAGRVKGMEVGAGLPPGIYLLAPLAKPGTTLRILKMK